MTIRYKVYGLGLRSDRPMPGLEAQVGGPTDVDVDVHLGARPAWADAPVTATLHRAPPVEGAAPGAPPVVVVERLGTHGVRLSYDEGIRFHVASALDGIWSDWDAPLDEADAMSFLLGPVLGHVLRARDVLALHASAVDIDGRLVGFVGPGGAGKSTLAASLAARGHAVLADDVLALRERGGRWWGSPSNAPLRLWEESARLLFGEGHGLPAVSGAWDKRLLALDRPGLRPVRGETPLAALLLLDGDAEPIAAPAVDAAGGQDALLSLIGNTYVSYLLTDAERAQELATLGRLVGQVPVGRLRRPLDGGDLGTVATAVERWARRVTL